MYLISKPDRRELREFGLVMGAIVAGLFGLLFPWVFDRDFPGWPWVFAAVFAAWAILAPASLGPVYIAWMKVGQLLNRAMTPVILSIVFFLVITPMAIIRRLFVGNSFLRSFDDSLDSYRIPTKKSNRRNLKRPF